MTVLILDGDVACYDACIPRWENKVTYTANGDRVKKLDQDGASVPFEYSKEEDQKYMEESWERLKRNVQTLQDKLYCDDLLMAVGLRDNFRLRMYPDYKANRHKKESPTYHPSHFVPLLRELAVFEEIAVMAQDREADDYLRIWAEECRSYGIDYVVASVDKDLKCIPGKRWNTKKKKLTIISEEEAMRFYYEQLLQGDSTDKIPGLPSVGPVSAKKFLADCHYEYEFQKTVVELYKAVYEDKWRDYLLSNGKMITLQRHWDDYFSLEDWKI